MRFVRWTDRLGNTRVGTVIGRSRGELIIDVVDTNPWYTLRPESEVEDL